MALAVLRAEFQKSRFLYSYHDNRVFFACHWKVPRPVFVGIRVVMSLYSMYALTHYLVLYSLIVEVKQNIMVYFTTWSYVFLTAHMAMAALLSILCYKHVNYERSLKANMARVEGHQNTRQSDHVEMDSLPPNVQSSEAAMIEKPESTNSNGDAPLKTGPGCEKIHPTSDSNIGTYESLLGNRIPLPGYSKYLFMVSWALSDIQLCASAVVTIIYFTTIYPYLEDSSQVDLQDVNVHILNLAFVVIDFALGARPIRLLHSWMPMLYGICWALFSVLYWSTDHANHIVYKFIDWNKPAFSVACAAGLACFMIIIMFLYFGLYRLKIWLYTVVHKEEYYVIINED